MLPKPAMYCLQRFMKSSLPVVRRWSIWKQQEQEFHWQLLHKCFKQFALGCWLPWLPNSSSNNCQLLSLKGYSRELAQHFLEGGQWGFKKDLKTEAWEAEIGRLLVLSSKNTGSYISHKATQQYGHCQDHFSDSGKPQKTLCNCFWTLTFMLKLLECSFNIRWHKFCPNHKQTSDKRHNCK